MTHRMGKRNWPRGPTCIFIHSLNVSISRHPTTHLSPHQHIERHYLFRPTTTFLRINWVFKNSHVLSLTKFRQGWRLIHGDLKSSKPISYSCVRKVRAKFRVIKIVHSGTNQNIYCKLNEIHTKLSVTKKNTCRKKIVNPPSRKKHNH